MSIAGFLDRDLAVPLYHQLQAVLKAELESGKWRPDEQLPNETKLAELYQVSKITLRRKFDEGPRELTSFTEEMRRHELVATSRVLSQRRVEADAKVADALRLPAKSSVFVLKRVRLAAGEPVSVQTTHIPAAFVPGLEVTEKVSLYEVLQRRYHLYPVRARETYFAAAANAAAAELLGIPAGAPVFTVERVTLLANEKPFEFVQSVVRGDRYSIVLDLVKHDGGERALTLRSAAQPRGRRRDVN
jgi:GntR family transcriptional regulator